MATSLDVNTLYYGDNLEVLRDRNRFPSESVDLIYLDPPFNSARGYNVLFGESGDAGESEAQIRAFEDTWHWDRSAERTWKELTDEGAEERGVPSRLIALMESLRPFLGDNDVMAYLVMMAIRLVELRRVLKPMGSLYLHCDPTASHYLKLVLDGIFGPERFINELIWKRTSGHSDAERFGNVHDVILFYAKGDKRTWNEQFTPYDPAYVDQYYRYTDEDGRRFMSGDLGAAGLAGGGYDYEWKEVRRVWRVPLATMEKLDREGRIFYTRNGIPRIKRFLDEAKGLPVQDVITDVEAVRSWHEEKLGYPTQKPLALLERIIRASSSEGDVVLDPFCGCGTAIDAAQRLGRTWIGIDVTHLAIALIRNRLDTAFPGLKYEVRGEPADSASARALAEAEPYQFQWWALHLVGAHPIGDVKGREGKKGKDRGIDGVLRFKSHPQAERSERVLVSVKAGHNLNPGMVRDLRGTIEREGAPIGVLLTMYEPSREMRIEATKAGEWTPDGWDRAFPRVQLITVEEAFAGRRVDYPGMADRGDTSLAGGRDTTLKAAPREGTLKLPGIDPGPGRGKGRGRRK